MAAGREAIEDSTFGAMSSRRRVTRAMLNSKMGKGILKGNEAKAGHGRISPFTLAIGLLGAALQLCPPSLPPFVSEKGQRSPSAKFKA